MLSPWQAGRLVGTGSRGVYLEIKEDREEVMHALVGAIPVIGWLLYAGIAQATPVVDQQFTPSGSVARLAVANDRTQIQTFTVGITGTLTDIDVRVSKGSQTVADLMLSLWSTNAAGLPQTQLAADSVASTDPAFAPPGSVALVPFDLTAAAVPVAAGEFLAIELNSNASNNPPFDQRYEWEIGGEYNRGAAYTQIGTTIFPQTDDFHFVDFVNPAPEPGTLALLSTGLAGLLAYGWRRRRGAERVARSAASGLDGFLRSSNGV
jgi:PEP-CTERM motif